uniref:Strictosidine synthase conserved region domain-containing protein n=1 Tax=Chenopodium quinoa TaxID=63459 RepID=A0A803LUI0_CHEQI
MGKSSSNNTKGRQYHRLPLGFGATGAESIAFDCEGNGPYVGVSDGRILKWQGHSVGWTVFAITYPERSDACDRLNDSPAEQYCGRPLGLKFNTATCELYVTDSSVGLVKVGRNGGVATSIATSAKEGLTLFCMYREFRAITRSDRSGRLLRYDPKSRRVTVLMRGLSFANGVALSKKKDFILVTETSTYQVQKYWLTGTKAGTAELFIQLSGRPDNINRNSNGDFWISQNPTKPIKINESGTILESLNTDIIVDASDVTEFHNNLWIGSVIQNYIIYTS